MRFVAIGDVMVDVLACGRGHGARVELAPGGSAVNACFAARAAGAEAEVVGRIGDDAAGRMLAAELSARGVRASLRVDPELPTGTFLLVDGEPRADRGANAAFLPGELPEDPGAEVVLVSGYLPAETVAAALTRFSAPWIALATARLERVPEGGNAVFLDAEEAAALTGLEAEAAARTLGERYRLACVTLGPEGALGVCEGRLEAVRVGHATSASSRPGAGDAFAGATLVALARGASLRDALLAGCRAGAEIAARTWPTAEARSRSTLAP